MTRKEQLAQIENLRKMIEQSEGALQRVRSTLNDLEERLQTGKVCDELTSQTTMLSIADSRKNRMESLPEMTGAAATRPDKNGSFSPAVLAGTALAGN